MSPDGMRLVRGSTKVAVFLTGIAIGLSAAVLAAAALSATPMFFFFFIWPLGLIGLVGGAILGGGAAGQLWPPDNEGAPS
jgi:hypothetical protein